MSTITVSTNAPEYQQLVHQAMTLMRKDVTEMLLDEARLRFIALYKKTPPNRGGSGSFGKGVSDYSIGRANVARDILRVFRPISAAGITDQRWANMIRKRDYKGLNERLKYIRPHAAGMQVVPFDPFFYYPKRNKRGVVPKQRPEFATPDVRALNAYIAKKRKRVGMARGGWAKTITALKGKVPNWVARHSFRWGTFSSSGLRRITTPSGVGYFEGANLSPWAGNNAEAERVTKNALNSRSEALRRKIAHLLQKKMQNQTTLSPRLKRTN